MVFHGRLFGTLDSELNSVTLSGRSSHLPGFNLAVSAERTKTWSETREVIRASISPGSPRRQFAMDFSPLPGSKLVPGTLVFAVLITYPAKPVPFGLNFQIKIRDVSNATT
jgi:hypothetical protein